MLVSCQEGWHRPALSLFAKVFDVFSCTLLKVACFQKFAFAKRSAAMKAPVELLSDRTVLRSKMEGPRPDKFAFAKRSAAMKAPVELLSDRTVLRSKMEGPRPDKFAFAKRSGAMKAPLGLLSDRTVLCSKMEGPRPDKFTLTRHEFCGNLSQQFNIYIKGGAGAKDHGRERTAVQHLHPRSPRPAENSLFLCGGMGLDPQDSPAP